MLHTIIPFTDSLLQNQIILCIDTIGQMSCILERNLLIPSFVSGSILTFERIDTIQRNIQVRQRNINRRVFRILRKVERTRQVQTNFRKVARITHT